MQLRPALAGVPVVFIVAVLGGVVAVLGGRRMPSPVMVGVLAAAVLCPPLRPIMTIITIGLAMLVAVLPPIMILAAVIMVRRLPPSLVAVLTIDRRLVWRLAAASVRSVRRRRHRLRDDRRIGRRRVRWRSIAGIAGRRRGGLQHRRDRRCGGIGAAAPGLLLTRPGIAAIGAGMTAAPPVGDDVGRWERRRQSEISRPDRCRTSRESR